MKYKKTDNKFATFLSSIVIMLLVVVVVGFLYYRTDGLTTGLKDFYIACNGSDIMQDRDNFAMSVGKEYRFDIHSEKDKLLNSESTYSVSVVPNITAETTFAFKVDNKITKYADITSLSSCFVIMTYKDYFTIKTNYDLLDMFKDRYKTDNIVDCPTTINSGIDYYKLIVSSNESVINVNFNLISE